MKTISMPFEEYNDAISKSEIIGRKEAMRRFLLILKQAKKDPRDAITMIVEDFEDDQRYINQMIDALGLRKLADEIYNGHGESQASAIMNRNDDDCLRDPDDDDETGGLMF